MLWSFYAELALVVRVQYHERYQDTTRVTARDTHAQNITKYC